MGGQRDRLMTICLLSVAEGYAILHFAPQLRPPGGLGRLGFRLFLLNAFLTVCYDMFIWPFFVNPLRKLPGPKGGNLIVGHGMQTFHRPPGEKLRQIVNTVPNDGLLYFRTFFNKPAVVPTRQDTLKAVLAENTYDYEKPMNFVKILRRVLGDGLILVEGNVHKFQRKHLMPSFQVQHIRKLYPMFWKKSCELASMLSSDAQTLDKDGYFEFEFGEWCMRATLDIIGIAGLGRDFNALSNPEDELVKQYEKILSPDKEKLLWFALQVVFPQWIISALPWHINTEITRIQEYLYSFALDLVKDRRSNLTDNEKSVLAPKSDDILTLLVQSNDFTDHELADQVLTMMAAGHETTSSALSWCTYLLSLHPDIQRQVRNEVRGVLPNPDATAAGETITAAQIDTLPMLNAVCNETTRLYPTVPVTIREVVRETPLGGLVLPKGTEVLLAPWAINRSEHFWGADAGEFRPERWINEDDSPNNTGGCGSNYALLTFLHGPRSCIGQGFARSELKCLLAAVVGRYEFSLSRNGNTYFPAGLVTTKPQDGMWLRMKTIEGW